ncbi:MAG: hypothetical protein HQL87_17770 [Magnetococcales bacterium]|nr:hypothetical protein [Magnetococcales bacterium]
MCMAGIRHHPCLASHHEWIGEEIRKVYTKYQFSPNNADDDAATVLLPLLGGHTTSAPQRERFIDTLFRLDRAAPVAELVQFIQGTPHDPYEMVAAVTQLLAKARLRTAYMLAMLLTNRGYRHVVISFALSIGGLVYQNPAESAQGLVHLQPLVDALSDEQLATFHQQIVMPTITPWLATASAQADDHDLQQILMIVYATVPSLRPWFDQDRARPDEPAERGRQRQRAQAHRVVQEWQKR